MIDDLQTEYKRLQKRIDQMYEDKLDGVISQDLFQRKSEEYAERQRDITALVLRHQEASEDYIDYGVRLLELSQKAVALYEQQSMEEKRRLLEFVCSNSVWLDGQLVPSFRKPFDILADANQEVLKRKGDSVAEIAHSKIWLPGRYSKRNPQSLGLDRDSSRPCLPTV